MNNVALSLDGVQRRMEQSYTTRMIFYRPHTDIVVSLNVNDYDLSLLTVRIFLTDYLLFLMLYDMPDNFLRKKNGDGKKVVMRCLEELHGFPSF